MCVFAGDRRGLPTSSALTASKVCPAFCDSQLPLRTYSSLSRGHLGDYAAAAAAAYCASISHMFSISGKQEKRQKV